jgi:hypothetical protein
MSLEFLPTAPEDLDAVSALLLAGFKAAPGATFVDQRLLHWKYFEAGPQWSGSRGYMLKQGSDIQAHCGVWPVHLSVSAGNVSCLCFVDWVSDRSAPGSGFLIKKKLMTLAETAIVVGGTDDTRAVIPRLGFEIAGEVGFFVRVARPWKQFRTRPTEGVGKDLARLIRNTAWSRIGKTVSTQEGWSAEKLEFFEDSLLKNCCKREDPTPWRSAKYLNYWLRSPTVAISGFAIKRAEKNLGYFLLSRVGGQTRIADLRLGSTIQDDWNAAYSLAETVATEDPETCEITAVASTLFSEIALRSSGFRQRGSAPLFLYDPKRKLRDSPPIYWNLIDGDAAYIHDPEHPYTT